MGRNRSTALQLRGRVFAPDLPDFRALADELADYEIRVTGNAHATAGAFKAGSHDDLATALGLALVLPYRTQRAVALLDPGEC
jgi:hypothetical protein